MNRMSLTRTVGRVPESLLALRRIRGRRIDGAGPSGAGGVGAPDLVHEVHGPCDAGLKHPGPVLFLEGEADGLQREDLASLLDDLAPGSPGPPDRPPLSMVSPSRGMIWKKPSR